MLNEYQKYYESLLQTRPPENLQEEKIEQDVNIKFQKIVDDEHNVERKTITQLEVKIRTRVKEEGQIPLQWRETSIKSLYKGGGSKEKIQESQRGIFITNIVSKAYETGTERGNTKQDVQYAD